MSRLRNSTALILSIFILLNGILTAFNAVICVGPEGHFAIEKAHNGHCDSTPSAQELKEEHAEAFSILSAHADSDADCIDFSLTLTAAVPGKTLNNQQIYFSAQQMPVSTQLQAIISGNTNLLQHNSDTHLPTDPHFRKTTVLLI
ncbi:MAG: hypothetical protein HQK83_09040 [Fibrobacteria bacterium]|nr:hypothetical protein [Fibrobacteria bacterium]